MLLHARNDQATYYQSMDGFGGHATTIVAVDADRDGKLDLFVNGSGGHQGCESCHVRPMTPAKPGSKIDMPRSDHDPTPLTSATANRHLSVQRGADMLTP